MTTSNTISNVIDARNRIVRLALNGDAHYTHEAIGADDGDINEMTDLIGLPLVWSARADDDAAIYSDGQKWAIVADCNGPVVITEVTSSSKNPYEYATDSESGTIEANSLEEAFAALRAGITDEMIADGATLWVEDGSGQRITMQEVAS